jgi:hypothetical protein
MVPPPSKLFFLIYEIMMNNELKQIDLNFNLNRFINKKLLFVIQF